MPTDPDNGGDTLSNEGLDTYNPGPEREAGPAPSGTWWSRAIRRSDKQNERADERVDAWAGKALATAEASANRAWWIVRFQWLVIGALVLAVIALAGYSVGVDLPAMGQVTIGG